MSPTPQQNLPLQPHQGTMAGPSANGSRRMPFNVMPNRPETTGQSLGLTSGIWATSSWNKSRSTLKSSRDTTDSFAAGPSGSGALAASSEAEPSFPPSWPTQKRATSGNTSPNRPRTDAALDGLSNSSAFFAPSQPQPAIGQRPPGRDAHGPFNSNGFGSVLNDSEASMYQSRGPAANDEPFAHMPARPQPRLDNDLSLAGNTLNDRSYGAYAATNSQRPSFSGQSSFAVQNHHGLGNGTIMDETSLANQFDSMMLSDANGPSNSTTALQDFQATHPSFQLNPGSQAWDNGRGYRQGALNNVYGNGLDRRGSGVDRASPAGSAYHSPRSFSGTPQPVSDPWGSRPASRDHRNPLDSERRNLGPQFLPPQAQPYAPAQYSMNTNFPQYTQGQYGAFQQAHQLQGFSYPYPPPHMPGRPSRDNDPVAGARSPLLEEFKNSQKSSRNQDRRWELKDIYGHVVEFAGDQHGSRFIQRELESANSEEKDCIFQEIVPNVIALQKDVFGNYVIQKLYEHGNQLQKKVLADKMRGQVVSLSMQMYACRVVQKALEHILVEQQAELVKELESDIVKVMKDSNGNHVVQKIIELVPRQYIGFVMDCFTNRVGEFALHNYACRVVQRALEYGNEDDKRAILGEIHSHTAALVTDQYGNYVAQHVIEYGEPEDRSRIIAHVTNELVTLSKHKFASNVVEKCIQHGTAEEQRRIAEKLIGTGEGENLALQGVMKDQYGNYVVQKLVKTLIDPESADFGRRLRDAVKLQIPTLKRSIVHKEKHILATEVLVNNVELKLGSSANGSPTPVSPGLQGNGGSAVPTPNLTTEPNSPSSNPPSTKASSVGDMEHHTHGKLPETDSTGTVTIAVHDDDS